MKTYLKQMALTIAFISALLPSKRANAEDIPAQFNSVFSLIEPFVLSGGGGLAGLLSLPSSPGGAVSLIGCQPALSFKFPTVSIQFGSSSSCAVSGYITINMIPLNVNVRLAFAKGPIEKLEADFVMHISRANKVTYLNWQILNGYVSIRESEYMKAEAYYLSGEGQRARSKGLLTVNSRINLINANTMLGTAFLKEMTKVKKGDTVKKVTACSLTGASKDDVLSGTIDNCRVL